MNIQPFANTLRSRCAGVLSLAALVLAGAALAAACAGGDEGAPATSETAAPAGTQAVTGLDFPTGAGGAGGRRLPVPGRPRRLDGGVPPREREADARLRRCDLVTVLRDRAARRARAPRRIPGPGELRDPRLRYLGGEGAGEEAGRGKPPLVRAGRARLGRGAHKKLRPAARADAARAPRRRHRQPRRVAGATGARDGVS